MIFVFLWVKDDEWWIVSAVRQRTEVGQSIKTDTLFYVVNFSVNYRLYKTVVQAQSIKGNSLLLSAADLPFRNLKAQVCLIVSLDSAPTIVFSYSGLMRLTVQQSANVDPRVFVHYKLGLIAAWHYFDVCPFCLEVFLIHVFNNGIYFCLRTQ